MTVSNICRNILRYFKEMSRKKLIIIGFSIALAIMILTVIIVVSTTGVNKPSKGRDALSNTPLIDGHNDLPMNLRELLRNHVKDFHFEQNLTTDNVWGRKACKSCFTDLPRLKAGRVGAQFWVAYVDCKTQYKDAVAETLEQIDVIKRLIRKYPKDLQFATTPDGIIDAFENNKIGSLIAVEGGHSIDSRLGVLRMFYNLGVRYMTLTHTCDTPWADASTAVVSKNKLTEFGKVSLIIRKCQCGVSRRNKYLLKTPKYIVMRNFKLSGIVYMATFCLLIVKEMNRLGMMVDLSHVSADVMRDAIKTSAAPVIFSHSSAYAIHNNPRNVPDDVLTQVTDNEGIVMVNFYPGFLGPNKDLVNIKTVIDHINHIVDKAGIDHVGIGADYDGVTEMPNDLEDVSKYPLLFDMLHLQDSKKWSITNLEKLAGKNLLRVFKRVEEVRDKLDAKDEIIDDWIPKADMDAVTDKAVKQCRQINDSAAEPKPPTTVTKAPTTVTEAPTTVTEDSTTAISAPIKPSTN